MKSEQLTGGHNSSRYAAPAWNPLSSLAGADGSFTYRIFVLCHLMLMWHLNTNHWPVNPLDLSFPIYLLNMFIHTHRKPLSASLAPPSKHVLSIARFHSCTETMFSYSPADFWLISSFRHTSYQFLDLFKFRRRIIPYRKMVVNHMSLRYVFHENGQIGSTVLCKEKKRFVIRDWTEMITETTSQGFIGSIVMVPRTVSDFISGTEGVRIG